MRRKKKRKKCDLISRETTKKYFVAVLSECDWFPKDRLQIIEVMFNIQPTAYDREKVRNELLRVCSKEDL